MERERELENMKSDYSKACNAYVAKLNEMWDIEGWWCGDIVGGNYCFLDTEVLRMDEIILCVEENISLGEYNQWSDYNSFAREFHQNYINLASWHKGYHGMSKEAQANLRKLKKDFDDAIRECKEKF